MFKVTVVEDGLMDVNYWQTHEIAELDEWWVDKVLLLGIGDEFIATSEDETITITFKRLD